MRNLSIIHDSLAAAQCLRGHLVLTSYDERFFLKLILCSHKDFKNLLGNLWLKEEINLMLSYIDLIAL